MKKTISKIDTLKEKLEVLEGVAGEHKLTSELRNLKDQISILETQVFAHMSLEDILSSGTAQNLVGESDAHVVLSVLSDYEKLQTQYLKTVESIYAIMMSSTKSDIGAIRQNFLLAKLRKHFISVEKRRIPTESQLIELQDFFGDLKLAMGSDTGVLLNETLRLKRALNSKLKGISISESKKSQCEEQIGKFIALMDFTASNGSEAFDECEPNSRNFVKNTNETVRGLFHRD